MPLCYNGNKGKIKHDNINCKSYLVFYKLNFNVTHVAQISKNFIFFFIILFIL